MSSITFADHKTGGRFTAAADAIAEGHLNRAAGILAELADELNVEATAAGLLSEDVEAQPTVAPPPQVYGKPPMPLGPPAEPVDLQFCARNVHSFGAPDSNGWRTCSTCGSVNVAPPENNGFVDMSARQ